MLAKVIKEESDGQMGEGIHTGLVGFFDILGYQNLLERNEPEDIAEKVLPLLTQINNTVVKDIEKVIESIFSREAIVGKHKPEVVEDFKKHIIEKILKNINWLIFSDTILVTLPVEKPTGKGGAFAEEFETFFKWFFFLLSCVQLQSVLFDSGLPLRGAIAYGKFYVADKCFAGKTIVEAYKTCGSLELSACVISDSASAEIEKLEILAQKHKSQLCGSVVYEYLVPMKDGEKRMFTLAAPYVNQALSVDAQVREAFWGYNKDISREVHLKVSNTEQWLRFLSIHKK